MLTRYKKYKLRVFKDSEILKLYCTYIMILACDLGKKYNEGSIIVWQGYVYVSSWRGINCADSFLLSIWHN